MLKMAVLLDNEILRCAQDDKEDEGCQLITSSAEYTGIKSGTMDTRPASGMVRNRKEYIFYANLGKRCC